MYAHSRAHIRIHVNNPSRTLRHTQAAATALALAGQVSANATAALAEADAIATASAVATAAATTAAQAQLVVDNAAALADITATETQVLIAADS